MVAFPDKQGHCIRLVYIEDEFYETIEAHGSEGT